MRKVVLLGLFIVCYLNAFCQSLPSYQKVLYFTNGKDYPIEIVYNPAPNIWFSDKAEIICYGAGAGETYFFVSSNSTEFIFKFAVHSLNGWFWYDNKIIKISKNWNYVSLADGTIYNRQINKSEYEKLRTQWNTALYNLAEMANVSSSNSVSGSYSSSSNSNNSSSKDNFPSDDLCRSKQKLYFQYESSLSKMKTDPSIYYNDSERRNLQSKMRQLRNEMIQKGCDNSPYKSYLEDWSGN